MASLASQYSNGQSVVSSFEKLFRCCVNSESKPTANGEGHKSFVTSSTKLHLVPSSGRPIDGVNVKNLPV